jgi:protoporphyrinogen oxidase
VGDTGVDLAVLGAGPAGLAAAWWAARRGLSVLVLERAPGVGGMAGSFEVAGVRVDFGSHRLHPATPPDLLAALRAELGGDLRLRPRNGRLRVYGRWVGFPLRPAELVRALPPRALGRIARDAVGAPLRRPAGDSFGAVLSARLGPELYGELYAPYARKLWGLDAGRIDGEQARRRVTADSPWKIASRLLRRDRTGQGRAFWYPRRGFGQLTEALAHAATTAGGTIRTGAEVSTVDVRGAPVVRLANGDTVHCGHVLSTVPLPVLARLIRPAAPQAVVDAAAGLRFRAMLLVYLVHGSGQWTPYDAHYLPGPQTPVTRVSEPKNYRDSPGDPADRTVLCAEIPTDQASPLWTATDAELATLVRDGLRATGLPPVDLTGVHTRRIPHVYPVYETGYADRLGVLDTWVTGLDRVTTFGRLGLFAHDNTHHALAMAAGAVGALGADGRRDRAAWAAARERFAGHVVED